MVEHDEWLQLVRELRLDAQEGYADPRTYELVLQDAALAGPRFGGI